MSLSVHYWFHRREIKKGDKVTKYMMDKIKFCVFLLKWVFVLVTNERFGVWLYHITSWNKNTRAIFDGAYTACYIEKH